MTATATNPKTLLRNLIERRGPIEQAVAAADALEVQSLDRPLTLKRAHVQSVIEDYRAGQMSRDQVEQWAKALGRHLLAAIVHGEYIRYEDGYETDLRLVVLLLQRSDTAEGFSDAYLEEQLESLGQPDPPAPDRPPRLGLAASLVLSGLSYTVPYILLLMFVAPTLDNPNQGIALAVLAPCLPATAVCWFLYGFRPALAYLRFSGTIALVSAAALIGLNLFGGLL